MSILAILEVFSPIFLPKNANLKSQKVHVEGQLTLQGLTMSFNENRNTSIAYMGSK